ncbi:hypothetical protein [Trebonia sp.]|uniref:hypothetical protein n=1 Tax=Trebonia sp. TaxID=2767075 RepID=UPI0026091F26|nr:hypothetical protein [Trebonia sp.]
MASVLAQLESGQRYPACRITETSPQAAPGLLDPTQDGYDDTDHDPDPDRLESMWDLDNPLDVSG